MIIIVTEAKLITEGNIHPHLKSECSVRTQNTVNYNERPFIWTCGAYKHQVFISIAGDNHKLLPQMVISLSKSKSNVLSWG